MGVVKNYILKAFTRFKEMGAEERKPRVLYFVCYIEMGVVKKPIFKIFTRFKEMGVVRKSHFLYFARKIPSLCFYVHYRNRLGQFLLPSVSADIGEMCWK